jgi:hypothetical protein
MKKIFTTTAIVTLLAFPVAAQEATQATPQAGQAQSGQMAATGLRAGQMEIQASSLIGQRLYILRDDAAMQQQGMGTQQTTVGAGATDQAAGQQVQPQPEGQATQQAEGQQVQPQPEGQATQQAEGQQVQPQPEGQATQQAEGQQVQPQPEGQATQQAEGQQVQPQPEGQATQQAEGQQVQPQPEGQATQQAEGQQVQPEPRPATQAGQQPGMNMAELEQGITDIPDSWTMAGEIDDVLMSPEGQVQALVIDSGGFLGMNESTRRIDIQQVQFVPDLDNEGEFYVVYTGDRATFEQSERFDETTLAEGSTRGTQMWGEELRGGQSDVAFTSLTSDDLVGTAVYGAEDNWVGQISELALTESGEVEAVIVDVGGFLGIGTRPVALTMEQIQLRRGEGGLFRDDLRAYVNATQEELESLPEWDNEG